MERKVLLLKFYTVKPKKHILRLHQNLAWQHLLISTICNVLLSLMGLLFCSCLTIIKTMEQL